MPDSSAIRLTINDTIAGKRVFNDNTRGTENQYETAECAIQKTRERKMAEIESLSKDIRNNGYNVNLGLLEIVKRNGTKYYK